MVKRNRNLTLAAVLGAVVFGMVGLSFAAVPLYDLFCQVTGYGGTTQRAASAGDRVLDREVVVQFDANVVGLPWLFRPEVAQVRVRLGETAIVNFVAENRSARRAIGTATFNVQPDIAGAYFNKIECFCFTEQPLRPGERVEMPVQFFLAPEMADDPDMNPVHTVTLSYTFFAVPNESVPGESGPDEERPVAQAGADADGKNM